jgi:hypothetical protein
MDNINTGPMSPRSILSYGDQEYIEYIASKDYLFSKIFELPNQMASIEYMARFCEFTDQSKLLKILKNAPQVEAFIRGIKKSQTMSNEALNNAIKIQQSLLLQPKKTTLQWGDLHALVSKDISLRHVSVEAIANREVEGHISGDALSLSVGLVDYINEKYNTLFQKIFPNRHPSDPLDNKFRHEFDRITTMTSNEQKEDILAHVEGALLDRIQASINMDSHGSKQETSFLVISLPGHGVQEKGYCQFGKIGKGKIRDTGKRLTILASEVSDKDHMQGYLSRILDRVRTI